MGVSSQEKSDKLGVSLRLKQFMKDSGLKIKDIQETTDIGYRTVQHYLKGDRNIKNEFLRALNYHHGVSLTWLLTGRGQMYGSSRIIDIKTNYSGVSEPVRELNTLHPKKQADEKQTEKAIEQSASIRVISMIPMDDGNGWATMKNSRLDIAAPAHMSEDTFAVHATGASMQPHGIFDGHICFCDPRLDANMDDIVCIEHKMGDDTVLAIKIMGLIGSDSIEVYSYKQTTEADGREVYESHGELIRKKDIVKISVVSWILTRSRMDQA